MNGDFSLVHQNVSHELTEERWRRLEELFHAARELGEPERLRFLEIETAGQPELRRELEEMLAHAGTAAGLLAGTVSRVARQASGCVNWVGRRVGPYRLVREIGRGGMGVVFEARRDDDEYRKTVALKLAPAWRDWETLGERLRHERQILAGLEHPNIARFLEGGSQDGVPYFAMEYVEGSRIGEFCKLRRPSVRARIDLFRQVCGAVHYAHERLVVHRDLKPANILVTREGVPKLLDFGIAKLLTPVPGEENTTGGTRLWTPDYTSPEQVRCGAITTRTDVYLLGLILYELLCGEKAQETDGSSPLKLDRSVCETEPAPPSQRAAAAGDAALARELRGDLDTIVAMALRKEPERRYGSAAALSEDLARYLEGRPVVARPGSVGYRLGKLVKRNRAAVAAAVLVAISTTAGVMATVYQARRAERRFQEVRRLANSVLFGVDDRIRNLAGATEAREWAVRNAVQYLNELAKDAGNDRTLLFELATAYQKVGDVQGYGTQPSLGHTQEALESPSEGAPDCGISRRTRFRSEGTAAAGAGPAARGVAGARVPQERRRHRRLSTGAGLGREAVRDTARRFGKCGPAFVASARPGLRRASFGRGVSRRPVLRACFRSQLAVGGAASRRAFSGPAGKQPSDAGTFPAVHGRAASRRADCPRTRSRGGAPGGEPAGQRLSSPRPDEQLRGDGLCLLASGISQSG
jgi:hypothetical protein